MDAFLTFSQNSSPVVRFYALDTFGEMSATFSPKIQSLHKDVVPVFLASCEDEHNKVRRMAPRSLSLYIEEMDYESLF